MAMSRLVVALGPGVDVTASDLAAAWDSDDEAAAVGRAMVETSAPGTFIADVLALVVIPLLVNVSSSAVYDMVRRAVAKARLAKPSLPDVEVVEVISHDGDRVVVVRLRENR
jgi:hypothetical protein